MHIEKLTEREWQCLLYAARDCTMQETAKALYLSYDTVKSHRRSLLRKLRCRTITGALLKALERDDNAVVMARRNSLEDCI